MNVSEQRDFEDATGRSDLLLDTIKLQDLPAHARTHVVHPAAFHNPFAPLLPGVLVGGKLLVSFGLEPVGHLQANLLGGKHRRQLFHLHKLQHHLVVEALILVVDCLVANAFNRDLRLS